jgi:hypothetical protein
MCWNYWKIYDNEIIIPPIYTLKHNRLGDSISILMGMEGVQENIVVANNRIFKQLMEYFQFEHVKYLDDRALWDTNLLNVDNIFGSCSWEKFWLERFGYGFSHAMGLHYSPTTIPTCKLGEWRPNGDKICFQFDSRSAENMDVALARRLIAKLAGDGEAIVLGGVESTKYLGDESGLFRYSFGDIQHEIRELLGCRQCVAVDSGIAHLAGMLGVKTTVINLIEQDTVIRLFGGYRNMNFMDREMMGKIL